MGIYKNICFLAVVFSIFSCLNTQSAVAQLTQGEKDTILIGRLQVQPSLKDMAIKEDRELELNNVAESLETQFINALSMTGVFQIVERKRKGDIELEQAFAAVAVNPNDKNAAKALKISGAKFVFLPQIDGFEDITETEEYAAVGRETKRRKIFLSAVVEIVDTTTGELLPDVPSVQLNKSVEAEMIRPGTPMASERAVIELAKEMANKLSQKSVVSLRPAKVLSITGKEIFINRGSESGFNKGDLVEIFTTEDIKDEDTGTIYKKEVPLGQASITRIDTKNSYATIIGEDLGIVKGCIVRVVKSTEPTKPAEKELTPGSSEKPLKWTE